jgi:hypothetical protein
MLSNMFRVNGPFEQTKKETAARDQITRERGRLAR